MAGIQRVTFALSINEDAIREDCSLDQWGKLLDLNSPGTRLTWEKVFEKIGQILLGCQIYERYCHTAQSDSDRFSRYLLSASATVTEQAPSKPAKVATPVPVPVKLKA